MHERLARRAPITWVLLGLAGVFALVGLVFATRPDWGASVFGIPARDSSAAAYVRAIAFRDLSLSLYIAALTLFAGRRAVALLLALTTIIPVCDFILVLSFSGLSALLPLLLHAASAICFSVLTVWAVQQHELRETDGVQR